MISREAVDELRELIEGSDGKLYYIESRNGVQILSCGDKNVAANYPLDVRFGEAPRLALAASRLKSFDEAPR